MRILKRKSLAEQFFTEEESRRVREAVATAESRTSGEIVVMVVSDSHDYPETRQGLALLTALLLGLLTVKGVAPLFWWSGDPLWLFLGVFLCLFMGLGFLLPYVPLLWRWAIPAERARFEVEREAVLNFYSKGLQHTREATGVLLFISVLERRVHILADRGISRVFPQGTWEGLIQDLTAGIRAGQAATVTVATVERLAVMLTGSFPAGPEGDNELEDLIIVRAQDRPKPGQHLVIR